VTFIVRALTNLGILKNDLDCHEFAFIARHFFGQAFL
jgi:hypothetical protein